MNQPKHTPETPDVDSEAYDCFANYRGHIEIQPNKDGEHYPATLARGMEKTLRKITADAAQLRATNKELLEALELICAEATTAYLNNCEHRGSLMEISDQARAAIAKAKGEAQ